MYAVYADGAVVGSAVPRVDDDYRAAFDFGFFNVHRIVIRQKDVARGNIAHAGNENEDNDKKNHE